MDEDTEKKRLINCIHCGKELKGRKLKYCNDFCKYWYHAIKRDSSGSLSKAQVLRMTRAGRSQRAGRVGCRYN